MAVPAPAPLAAAPAPLATAPALAPAGNPPQGWAELPPELFDIVVGRLPCMTDRIRASHVCGPWRRSIRADQPPKKPPPPAFPCLLLPASEPEGRTRLVCVLSGCRVHHEIHFTPPAQRFIGSHDGGWVMADFGSPMEAKNQLLNISSGQAQPLPSNFLAMADLPIAWDFADAFVVTATLSASPADARCLAAAIVGSASRPLERCLLMRRLGSPRAPNVSLGIPGAQYWMEDVVYKDGEFFALTQGNHLLTFLPLNADLDLDADPGLRRFPDLDLGNLAVRNRYLLHCHGSLLLVLKLTAGPPFTSTVRVFETTDEVDEWVELDAATLRRFIMFVGRGCSRILLVDHDQYPGYHGGVYFLDDAGSDCGLFSDGRVRRVFQKPDPAATCPPGWLLP